ncbi:MAG: hypothetical protein L3K26_20495, partial [Candidatus Hydrogenedentes bacterium]|nr:hypothetical protein [Candidatus Hydrogenedentota bacterium]
VVASAFANRHLHIILANFGQEAVNIETTDAYVPVDEPAAVASKDWTLEARSFHILRRSV